MIQCETEITELKSKSFQVTECLDAGVDIDLFSKTVISVVGDKHHGHPVIAGVTRNLFRATAIYIFHKDFFSCRTFIGQANACRVRQKQIWFDWRKKRCDFSSAGLSLRFRPRSIPSRNYKCRRRGSNPRHHGLQPCTLPAELPRQKKIAWVFFTLVL